MIIQYFTSNIFYFQSCLKEDDHSQNSLQSSCQYTNNSHPIRNQLTVPQQFCKYNFPIKISHGAIPLTANSQLTKFDLQHLLPSRILGLKKLLVVVWGLTRSINGHMHSHCLILKKSQRNKKF